jgi:L-ascorbate metabolism protein UlaG (beta-lactamase superfamily)
MAVDPYLTNSIYESGATQWDRKFAPPIAPDDLPELDAVFVTYHHDDHMDGATLQPLRRRAGTRFVIPRAHAHRMAGWGFENGQLALMNHLEQQSAGGVEVTAHAAMHDRFERDEDGAHLYLGYAIRYGGITICHTGDTVGFPELAEWLRGIKPDVLLIPINGRDYARTAHGIVGNTNFREAADLAAAAGADLRISADTCEGV